MTDPEILDLQRWLWSLGDYAAVARHLFPISQQLTADAQIAPGQRVLDVAVGNGNTASCAIAAGAEVVGVDISPSQLELARQRFAAEGLAVELHEGNAEALSFADASFDAVLSCMGVIFAPDHVAAMSELARVCRPGGTVAITAWAGQGWSGRVAEETEGLLPPPPPGAPRSDEWGDADVAVARFAAAGVDATVFEHDFAWTFGSVDEAAAFFTSSAAPLVAMFAQADALGVRDEVAEVLVRSLQAANRATDGTCAVPSPILSIVGSR